MSKAAAPLAAILCAALSAGPSQAESRMYKCVEGGRTIYQQQACAVARQPDAAASVTSTVADQLALPAPE